jgi:putative Holliday junction resolvase
VTVATGSDTPRRGVRLGVDVGTVRVGVAVSDPEGILATPVVTLARDEAADRDIDELVAMVADRDVVEVAVGLPKMLRGADGVAAHAARRYATALAARIAPVPVVLVDERLTSVQANRIFDDRKVSTKARRAVVDQLAAVTILQVRLDALRSTGQARG